MEQQVQSRPKSPICRKCGRPYGVMFKVGDNLYEHSDCEMAKMLADHAEKRKGG